MNAGLVLLPDRAEAYAARTIMGKKTYWDAAWTLFKVHSPDAYDRLAIYTDGA